MTSYKQNELYQKKASIWLLVSQGKSQNFIASLLNVNRKTLSDFLRSKDYQEFLLSVETDAALQEVIREWPELPLDEVYEQNLREKWAVAEKAKDKCPELWEALNHGR